MEEGEEVEAEEAVEVEAIEFEEVQDKEKMENSAQLSRCDDDLLARPKLNFDGCMMLFIVAVGIDAAVVARF